MADHYPRVTRAPQGLQCYFCEAEAADAKAETRSGFVYALGPKCRALLAAPPEREVFEGDAGVKFRWRDAGGVEVYDPNYGKWYACSAHISTGPFTGTRNTPANLRAIASALESGRGQQSGGLGGGGVAGYADNHQVLEAPVSALPSSPLDAIRADPEVMRARESLDLAISTCDGLGDCVVCAKDNDAYDRALIRATLAWAAKRLQEGAGPNTRDQHREGWLCAADFLAGLQKEGL